MTTAKACLTCKHVKFLQHEDWKPGYVGDTYNYRDVVERIREKELHEKAKCAFNPVWTEVFTSHHCGRWENGEYFNEDVSLHDLVWGNWMLRENKGLRKEVSDLKARLNNSRILSASRLARLKKKDRL